MKGGIYRISSIASSGLTVRSSGERSFVITRAVPAQVQKASQLTSSPASST
jgi:hypothetical protein